MAALMLLPLLYACQSEEPMDTPTTETDIQKHPITVKAHLPSTIESRAQITYNCPDTTREIFMWNEGDKINIINISKLSEFPYGIEGLKITAINGRNATFESFDYDELPINAGDTILALYGDGVFRRKYNDDATYDERNIFTIDVGTEANKPQYIYKNPVDTTLSYMKHNLKMYDILIVEEDSVMPEVHFKHLSAIMRITLRNASGKDIYPTKLEFKYPSVTGIESFFNTTLYCSVEDLELKAYDTDDLFKGSEPYTANIGTTINGKEGTSDSGESVPNGESYELYLSTVPRLKNASYGDSLTIHLIANHKTEHPFSISLKGFKEVITAGKRYWFDLTATPDSTLILTSEWEKLHPNEKAPGE